MIEAIAATARAITVLVADWHPLYRDAVARVVRQHRRLVLVAELEDGGMVGAEIVRLAPAVAVVDPGMPGLDCDRLIARLVREQVRTRVLLIGARREHGDAYTALARGAAGCLSRQTTAQQLAEAIQRVAAGKAVIAPELQTELAAQIRIREHVAAPPISPREREISVMWTPEESCSESCERPASFRARRRFAPKRSRGITGGHAQGAQGGAL